MKTEWICLAACFVSLPARADDFLKDYTVTRGYSLGRPTDARPTPDGKAVLFLRSEARDPKRSLYELDLATKQVRVVASADALLSGAQEKLNAAEKARRERQRLSAGGIAAYELSDDGAHIVTVLSGVPHVIERASGHGRALPIRGPVIDARFSPDGKKLAYVRDRDLYVFDLATMKEVRLTQSSDPKITFGLAEFVAQEELERMRGYWWSPDSTQLAFEEADVRVVETLYITDPAHPEASPEPWPYPRAGTANAKVRIGIVATKGGTPRFVDWDRAALPYVAKVVWKKKAPLTIVVLSRTQKHIEVLAADDRTGATKRLLAEDDAAWIDLDPSVPKWLEDGSGFLWSTEKSGRRVLTHHAADGAFKAALTLPEKHYVEVRDVDLANGTVVAITAPDPRERNVERVSFDGKNPSQQIAVGVLDAVVSDDHRVTVFRETTVAEMERTVVAVDGKTIAQLPSVAIDPPWKPRIELLEHAAIVWPRKHNKGQRLPVIVNVYGGPHVQMVTRQERPYLLPQWIADHGFAVVMIDGRGSAQRGREWGRAILGSFAKVPLDDQVAGLKELFTTHPDLDAKRVGIFGWSFGGYLAALATLLRPEVFKVGVAGAPVVDWHDYDTAYTERYLGLPAENTAGYVDSSLLTHAAKLARPLLLIHGTADDNVYFFHSLKLANAFARAGRSFDFLPLAAQTHMVSDPTMRAESYRRIVEYLARHLKAREAGSPRNLGGVPPAFPR